MTPKIGDRAIYFPRVPYGRQSELFCFVTRVVDADRGVVDLIAFPANSEMMHVSNVSPKGGLVQIHCWEPSAEEKRIAELEERLAAIEAIADKRIVAPQMMVAVEDPSSADGISLVPVEQTSQAKAHADLNEAVAKRGPGRPRKADAA